MAEGLSRIVGDTVPHNTASGSYSTTTRSGSRLFTASIHAWVATATSSLGPAGAGDGHARTKRTESRIAVRLMAALLASDGRPCGRLLSDTETRGQYSWECTAPCELWAAECPLTTSAAARRV